MLFINLKRIIRSGYQNFIRSGFTSIAGVLVMTITLFFITLLIFVQASLNASLNDVKDKVDVTVYFVPGTEESKISDIETSLKKLPEVKEVIYTSESEALATFKERHANDYLTLQALEELDDNPLGASLNVKAYDPSQYESVANYFESDTALVNGSLTAIDKVDYHQNKIVIDRLTAMITGAQKLGLLISFTLILISVIITFNTIKLIIYMSKDEIGVMRLVGAGNRYVQGPFVVSGVLIGLIAGILTIILFAPISIWLGNQMTNFLSLNLYEYYKSNLLQLLVIILGSGMVLGGVSSSLAVIRYLKK